MNSAGSAMVQAGRWRAALGLGRFLSSTLDHSKTFKRLSQVDHVLMRPEVYIGATEPVRKVLWIPSQAGNDGDWRVMPKQVNIVPGFNKIFDEILVNAADNVHRDKRTKNIDVSVDAENARISISNDGRTPPVVMHRDERVLIPQMIFGTLMTGSNFHDESAEKRFTAGRHGYGAKLTNIMSREFTVTIQDPSSRKLYQQSWSDNMKRRKDATLKTVEGLTPLTKVEFTPDLQRFGLASLGTDELDFMLKRTWEIAACLGDVGVSVTWNGSKVPIDSFQSFCESHGRAADGDSPLIYGKVHNYEFGVRRLAAEEKVVGAPHVSFVNSVATYRGGTHVNFLMDKVVKELSDGFASPRQAAAILRQNVLAFVKTKVDKPAFESQSKEMLTSPLDEEKRTIRIPAAFFSNVRKKSGIMDMVKKQMNASDWTTLQNATKVVKKPKKHLAIPKLEDALHAGTSKALDCTLILTEGDSAKALAMAGLSVVGREKFGVYPLRGKILNVRDASYKAVAGNAEIAALVKILGLKYGARYDTAEEREKLRYGKVMLMTDQDHDGHHIKALAMNVFDHFWPSLLRQDGFLETFVTPLVKARPLRASGRGGVHAFYDMDQFEEWLGQLTPAERGNFAFKYYKGLGTSNREEARDYFSAIDTHRLRFVWDRDASDLIDKIFRQDRASDRRDWLQQDPIQRYSGENELTYDEFVNKDVLEFSKAMVARSIPSVLDGLKPSQRKILYACFKKKLTKSELKVSQLAGYVAEKTAYHHGEASIQKSIVRMAQNFVGVNNIPLLQPNGQFGTRMQGGDDAASARYLFTRLSPLADKIFLATDESVLDYNFEDGEQVEPVTFAPIIPMALVNGTHGIGSGYATSIPAYHPVELVDGLLRKLDGQPWQELRPWYRGFTGQTFVDANGAVKTGGAFARVGPNTIRIQELPIGQWTEPYREKLCKLEQSSILVRSFVERFTDTTVHFDVDLTRRGREIYEEDPEKLAQRLGLIKSISVNMTMFDSKGQVKTFQNVRDIVDDFLTARLEMYEKRRRHQVDMITTELDLLGNKARFTAMMSSGEIQLYRQPVQSVISKLREAGLQPFNADADPSKMGYEYLLSIPVVNFTHEHVDKLEQKRDKLRNELEDLKATEEPEMYRRDLLALRKEILREMKPGGSLFVADAAPEPEIEKRRKQRTQKKSRPKTTAEAEPDMPQVLTEVKIEQTGEGEMWG